MADSGDHQRRISIDTPVPAMTSVVLESTITCPACGHAHRETMPTDACLFYYECTGCHILLRPKAGHCCVFCSYGSVVCPPMQSPQACCGPQPI